MRDVGEGNLAVGAVALLALIPGYRAAVQTAAVAAAVPALAHLAYLLIHIDALPTHARRPRRTNRRTLAGQYVGQDVFFLESFARAYALALAHSHDRAALDAFADLLAGAREELRLHASYAQRWDIDLGAVTPGSATLAYTDFSPRHTAALGGVGLTCAAMTPCMRLYAYLGRSLGGASDTYAEWVTTYADPAFEELTRTLERLLDAHADDTAVVHETYRRAMQLEVAFFEAAYRHG